jgi:tRNA-uridine 2-sulfurtransferase
VGLPFYTLGQRGGLAIGGRRGHDEAPWFVAAKDPGRNRLVVVQGADHPLLSCRSVTTGPVNWLAPAPAGPFDAGLRFRYRQADQPACVLPRADGGLDIEPAAAQRAVTPGQSAVLYAADRCLGGGVITQTAL